MTSYNHGEQLQLHGTSGLKIFAGEDLTYGDRKRLQQLQSDLWWRQQAEQKQRQAEQSKAQKQFYDQQTLQINQYRNQLQTEKANRLKQMEMAFKQSNFQQLQEKLDREAHQRQLDEEERLQHIEYVTKHDFYTENHDTCQSGLGRNRVLPYHWKGMSQQQRDSILEEQQKQRHEKQQQKELQLQQEKLFALQMQAQRKAVVMQDRANKKGMEQMRKGMDQYNRLKAEQMKKKAHNAYVFTQTYKNE